MRKTVIKAKWMRSSAPDQYPELFIEEWTIARVWKSLPDEWTATIDGPEMMNTFKDRETALDNCEETVKEWFGKVSPWEVVFDRKELMR